MITAHRLAPTRIHRLLLYIITGAVAMGCSVGRAQDSGAKPDDSQELAKKLANPVAALMSFPFQYNRDENLGANDAGSKSYLNIQPVIPLSLNADWNVITRTIVPLVDLQDVPARGDSNSGIGDVTASQFFSPKKPTTGGWIWGAGPVELLPTASERALGTGKLGLGPTFVLLRQQGPVTYGVLANHIWSVAGESDRAYVESTFLQPFLSYITKTKTTFTANTESTYDWRTSSWSVPINLSVAQLLKIGPHIVQFSVGARYWVTTPEGGPEGWGWRAVFTLLVPK